MKTYIVLYQDYDDVEHRAYALDLNISLRELKKLVGPDGEVIAEGTLTTGKSQNVTVLIKQEVHTTEKLLKRLMEVVATGKGLTKQQWEEKDGKFWHEIKEAGFSGCFEAPSTEYYRACIEIIKVEKNLAFLSKLQKAK